MTLHVSSTIAHTRAYVALDSLPLVGQVLLGLGGTYYQPLRGALVDPKMLAARAGSTIAGFGAYRALNILRLFEQE